MKYQRDVCVNVRLCWIRRSMEAFLRRRLRSECLKAMRKLAMGLLEKHAIHVERTASIKIWEQNSAWPAQSK